MMYRPLWIEINLAALRHNFKEIKRAVSPSVKVMATLKQEAYGHGLVPVAKELSRLGVDFFGLGSVEEAITLRKHGISKPLLVLSVVDKRAVEAILRYKITPTVVNFPFARALNREAGKRKAKAGVHIKVDTGMGRLGVWYREGVPFIKEIKKLSNLVLEGLFTHFPVADTDRMFTIRQIRVFNRLVEDLQREGIEFKYLHCANSVGLVRYKDAHFNLVRPGLILYGIKPSPLDIPVRPLLSLKSRVIFVKKVERGRSISYGRTFITPRGGFIATVACGYADGYPWNLSNRSRVIIKGRLFPLVGRVCMDHIMVDLGKIPVKEGATVTLIGRESETKVTAEELARWAQTIPYEIVTRLSLKIPRIYKFSL